MQKIENQLEELKRKQKKLTFLLGELIYKLYESQTIRFLYPSGGVSQEREVKRMLRLLDYLSERIKKFEEVYSEEDEVKGDKKVDYQSQQESVAKEKVAMLEESDKEPKPLDGEAEKEQKEPGDCGLEEKKATINEGLPEDEGAPVIKEANKNSLSERVGENISEEVFSKKGEEEIAEEVSVGIKDPFGEIISSAKFESDTERRLFEQNLQGLRSKDERERARSLRNIAHISDKNCLREVCKLAMNDKGKDVRFAALNTLYRFRDNNNEELYRMGLRDCDSKVKATAIKGLSILGRQDSFSLLEPLLKDEDPHVRAITGTYLGIYYGQMGVEKACELLEDESPHVRKSLADMLSVVKPEGALSTIKKLLEDSNEEVKKSAATALKRHLPAKQGR